MEHLSANKQMWNDRVGVHLPSKLYDLENWKAGATSLKNIELDLLEDLTGKRLLHLQCHFGQDTLSLARLGAEVTGLDLSDEGIRIARKLAQELGIAATFVESDVLAMAENVENGPFDVIYTSYGVTGWLPELTAWGQQIAQLLKPGGRFYIIEFHPFVWMYDDDLTKVIYSYFNVEPIIEMSEGTYTEGGEHLKHQAYYWNHSLSDVFQALNGAGLHVQHFSEYDYSPYDIFPRSVTVEKGFQIGDWEGKFPLVYAMIAEKRT